MAGKFRVEYGIHGAAVISTVELLTVNCLVDSEIDFAIDAVVSDLERCRREMKRRAIKEKDAIFAKAVARA